MTIHAKEFFICGFGRKKHHIHSEWSSKPSKEKTLSVYSSQILFADFAIITNGSTDKLHLYAAFRIFFRRFVMRE